jgi:hypothetical protein
LVSLEPFRAVSAELLPALEAVLAVTPFANPAFAGTVRQVFHEVPSVAESLAADLKAHAKIVEQGGAPIVREPEQPTEVAPVPDVERKTVFLLTDAKWDDVGGIRTAGRHREVSLPVETAAAAIKFGHASDPTTEDGADRAMKLAHWKSPDYSVHHPSICIDITLPKHPAGATEPVVSPPLHSGLETIGETRSDVAHVGR